MTEWSETGQQKRQRHQCFFVVDKKQKKYDEAETQLKAAKETASAAKAQWEKAKNGTRTEDKEAAYSMVARAEAAIKEIKSYVSETSIYAPTDGEVSNIIAESGELVNAGYPVVTLVKLTDSWITFNLREDLLTDIKMGSTINAKFPHLVSSSKS